MLTRDLGLLRRPAVASPHANLAVRRLVRLDLEERLDANADRLPVDRVGLLRDLTVLHDEAARDLDERARRGNVGRPRDVDAARRRSRRYCGRGEVARV